MTLKRADFQAVEGMGRSTNQMSVPAAVFAAEWFNEFLIVHKASTLSHTHRAPTFSLCGALPPAVVRPHFAVPFSKPEFMSLDGNYV
jgi:hypothetical protein